MADRKCKNNVYLKKHVKTEFRYFKSRKRSRKSPAMVHNQSLGSCVGIQAHEGRDSVATLDLSGLDSFNAVSSAVSPGTTEEGSVPPHQHPSIRASSRCVKDWGKKAPPNVLLETDFTHVEAPPEKACQHSRGAESPLIGRGL